MLDIIKKKLTPRKWKQFYLAGDTEIDPAAFERDTLAALERALARVAG